MRRFICTLLAAGGILLTFMQLSSGPAADSSPTTVHLEILN